MIAQLTLADALRDAAIQRVDEHADEQWKDAALESVHAIAREMPQFTTDAVWANLATWARTHDNRAMGAVMRNAAAQGWCRATGEWQQSARAVCHRRDVRVWESLIYNKAK